MRECIAQGLFGFVSFSFGEDWSGAGGRRTLGGREKSYHFELKLLSICKQLVTFEMSQSISMGW